MSAQFFVDYNCSLVDVADRVGSGGGTREGEGGARALGALPRIDEAFAAGRLSYSKVRAITRLATPANEERVLDVALAATGAQLEKICRGYRQATEGETDAGQNRYVRTRYVGDGMAKVEIVVSPDEAELVLKAIERTREGLAPADASSPRPSAGARVDPYTAMPPWDGDPVDYDAAVGSLM